MTDVITKFISQKISKVRWQPTSKQVVQNSDIFATGSWDDRENNSIALWSTRGSPDNHGPSEMSATPAGEPQLLCDAQHAGDVTDMQFTTPEHILVSSSTGSLTAYRYHPRTQTLSATHTWDKLHHHGARGCPCTGVASRGEDAVVTVGEDGRIILLNMDQRQPVRVIERGDSCSIHSVAFLKQTEVATVNGIGQLKVWDLRQSGQDPARILHLAGERMPLHCLDRHPTQPHIVATGGQEGTLAIWDMRQDKFPVTLLSAHSAPMWEVKFHPTHSDNLFTCSDDGSVWHWDGTSMSSAVNIQNTSLNTAKGLNPSSSSKPGSYVSPWLASDAAKHRLEISDLIPSNAMPINSLDIEADTLLCGTDGEQIYIVSNMHMR